MGLTIYKFIDSTFKLSMKKFLYFITKNKVIDVGKQWEGRK